MLEHIEQHKQALKELKDQKALEQFKEIIGHRLYLINDIIAQYVIGSNFEALEKITKIQCVTLGMIITGDGHYRWKNLHQFLHDNYEDLLDSDVWGAINTFKFIDDLGLWDCVFPAVYTTEVPESLAELERQIDYTYGTYSAREAYQEQKLEQLYALKKIKCNV